METTLLKGYVVCQFKQRNIASTEQHFAFVRTSEFVYSTIEEAEESISESNGYDTYTILPVYRRIKTEAK
jgi:hypothetical protein